MKRFLSAILHIVTGILVFLIALTGFSSLWAFTTWGDLDMDEIVFHLQNSLEGTGNGMIGDFLLKALLPSVLILAVFIILIILLKKGKRRILCSCVFLALALISALFVKNMIWQRLDMGNWIAGRLNHSAFIEDHYADPAKTELTFPEKKRNLIYIYLESMETTYADESSGGAFSYNCIPELTKIAMDNEDFSGTDDALNGGIVLPGTAFTTGAIFAHSAGLPLKVSIGGNFMDTQTAFFPRVTALGDILKDQGYRQIFLLGSDASFGGRRLYYHDHGDFEIRDYLYAKENGWIAPDYEVFWGFEDQKLFSFAKETLLELAEEDRPFNLTLLTVDTHYEDGYVCSLCDKTFGDNQYANVMQCSSRQAAGFLEWVQKQDFYENTTVILCGDHTTMDTDFCENVQDSYQRKIYTAFINSAVQPAQPDSRRTFSSFDLFPTTLSSLGVQIRGNRLALGTDLYSSEKTLLEQYGTERVIQELHQNSDFLESLEEVDANATDALLERYRTVFDGSLSVESYDRDTKQLNLRVTNLYFLDTLADSSLAIRVGKLEAEYQEEGKERTDTVELKRDPEDPACFTGSADISLWEKAEGELRINLYTEDGTAYKNIASEHFSFN